MSNNNTRPTQGHDALVEAIPDEVIREIAASKDVASCRARIARALTNLPTPQAEGELAKILSDPNAVHVNMLGGRIARPSVAQIRHIYGDALNEATPQAEASPLDDGLVGLTFADFRQVNERRCVEAFKHNLDDWSLSDWFTATLGELGEAANIAKKLNRIRDGIADANAEHETLEYLTSELADEIADAFIYLDLLAASQGIALQDAVASKFNKTSDKLGAPHKITALRARPSGDGEGE